MQSKARNTDPRYSKLAIGVCPDQWGVWFPEDPVQIPWEKALDEMAEAGFSIMEKPASAISSSAFSQGICTGSSGNQTPHWSGHTPMASFE